MPARPIAIAGSLPPLRGSYRPDLVGTHDEILPLYREQVELLAPYVDLFLCETMSSAAEGLAAATAAAESGKPVWVSWTLHEDQSGRLRSGESVSEAAAAIAHLPVAAFLANCCAPESISAAMAELAALEARAGGRLCQCLPAGAQGLGHGPRRPAAPARRSGPRGICRPCGPLACRRGQHRRRLLRHRARAYSSFAV